MAPTGGLARLTPHQVPDSDTLKGTLATGSPLRGIAANTASDVTQ